MNIVVAQSGGPTCAINASLLGVIKGAYKEESIETVYGSLNGIEGILYDNLVDLGNIVKTEEDMMLLRQTPSSALGSCRYKLPDPEKDPATYEKIVARLEEYGIGAMFYIGGNDSMDTVNKMSKYLAEKNSSIRVMGVPKTIDNDLPETDHTPGFGSAAKYLATTVSEILRDTEVYDMKSVLVIEVMGRQAGWLAASSSVLRANGETHPDFIYLPETDFSADRFINDLKKKLETENTVIAVVSEGVTIPSDQEVEQKTDAFGHVQLAGIGKTLENLIKEKLGVKVRSVELSVLQRCASHIASETDLAESEAVGAAAVAAAVKGVTGKMMAFKRVSEEPYKVEIVPVDAHLVANGERNFPTEWINEDKNNVTDEAVRYFLPLIEGEPELLMKNGLPRHIKLK